MVRDDNTANHPNLNEELHWEIQDWKSQFQAMDNDVILLEQVLISGAYQSNTLNLFERLQNFKSRLKAFKMRKDELRNTISQHESHLGDMEIYDKGSFEDSYYRKHDKLKTSVEYKLYQFQQLKLEILNYTEGLPKKHSGRKAQKGS